MPLKRMVRKHLCMDPQEQEEAALEAIQPRLGPDAAQTSEPGRPHQDFVESETRKYWQEISHVGSLTKPTIVQIGFDTLTIRLEAIFRARAHAMQRQR